MKHSIKPTMAKVLALVLMTMAATGVMADDKITFENGQLIIEDQDREKIIILNTDGMHDIVADVLHQTMDGMAEAMDELDDMQLEIHLGQNNQLSIETDDQMWEMNLDLIFRELGTALDTAFEGIDTDGWTAHEHWEMDSMDDVISDEDLAEELESLKDELKKLQKELNSLKEL